MFKFAESKVSRSGYKIVTDTTEIELNSLCKTAVKIPAEFVGQLNRNWLEKTRIATLLDIENPTLEKIDRHNTTPSIKFNANHSISWFEYLTDDEKAQYEKLKTIAQNRQKKEQLQKQLAELQAQLAELN